MCDTNLEKYTEFDLRIRSLNGPRHIAFQRLEAGDGLRLLEVIVIHHLILELLNRLILSCSDFLQLLVVGR